MPVARFASEVTEVSCGFCGRASGPIAAWMPTHVDVPRRRRSDHALLVEQRHSLGVVHRRRRDRAEADGRDRREGLAIWRRQRSQSTSHAARERARSDEVGSSRATHFGPRAQGAEQLARTWLHARRGTNGATRCMLPDLSPPAPISLQGFEYRGTDGTDGYSDEPG